MLMWGVIVVAVEHALPALMHSPRCAIPASAMSPANRPRMHSPRSCILRAVYLQRLPASRVRQSPARALHASPVVHSPRL